MNYNDTQFAELSKFEENFRTALSTPTGWTRRIAIPDQRRIKAIYTEATGERIPFNIGCGNCLLSLLKKAGKLYFEDKRQRDEAERKSADKTEREKPAPVPEPAFDPAPVETEAKPKKKDTRKAPAKKEKEKA